MGTHDMGNGYISLDDAHDPKYGDPHKVPIVMASKDTLKGYGNLVYDFDKEKIKMTPWPLTGKRVLCRGTGVLQPEATGEYDLKWIDDLLVGVNTAIGWGSDDEYRTARLPKGVNPKNKTACLVRESNYHPDGGQVFYPKERKPFVALLALPGDDIQLEDFKAFYCDGTFGIHVHAGVWHHPMFPVDEELSFRNKQGSVHACVEVDTVQEFGKYLLVPLKL